MAEGDDELRRLAAAARAYWTARVDSHLCDMALPSEQAWRSMFDRLVTDVAGLSGIIGRIGEPSDELGLDSREPLVWVWCVLDTMPNDHEQRYMRLREAGCGPEASGLDECARRLRNRGYVIEADVDDPAEQVAWLAALGRVLDDDLATLTELPDDVEQWRPDLWFVPGYSCSVVPVTRRHRKGEGRPARRRALLYHAVVPARIGSLAVALYLHPDSAQEISDDAGLGMSLGAAVFPGLTVAVERRWEDGFLVQAAETGTDDAALLRRQVGEAQEAGCDMVVWPELTMPPARLKLLGECLSSTPLEGTRIPLVFAGSWHVEIAEGRFVNRCEVLLGRGERLLSYDKRRRFRWNGLTEDIEVGSQLPVIVMEDRLIGIAVCRDYCDDNVRSSYDALPLDLVVVPSMGETSTADAHLRHAVAQRSRQSSATFVVQQNPTDPGAAKAASPPGMSFVIDGGPIPSTTHQDVPLRVHGLRRAP